jgi:DNA topoisomerase-1
MVASFPIASSNGSRAPLEGWRFAGTCGGNLGHMTANPRTSNRIRRVDWHVPGIRRRRRGRGFVYEGPRGRRVTDAATLTRIRGLAIPPAWENVWISPDERGHLQAVGTDAAGRRQYLYHERWRAQRGRAKHERMARFARELPAVRARVDEDLRSRGLTRERVLATAARLLDRAFFRVGGESYADENGSYGLATIRKRQVHVRGSTITFDYVAKGGVRRRTVLEDPDAASVIRALKRRTGGGSELLAWKDGGRWRDVRSTDINAYLKELAGDEFSAKDFRTWHATVLAAVVLSGKDAEATTMTSRRRLTGAAIKDVAGYLGNTPAVCRASYVDPRVIDRFMDAETIRADLATIGADELADPAVQARLEHAVLALLEGERGSLSGSRAA